MKYLFVCRANVGRSQAAMGLYNSNHSEKSESAGTITHFQDVVLKDREGAENIVQAMNELGIDISNNKPRQITSELVNDFDKVIVMAEPETIPDWLKNNPKAEIWTIEDAKDQDIETTRKIVQQIKSKVSVL
jgi:arsenate reductase (thioredoxin)